MNKIDLKTGKVFSFANRDESLIAEVSFGSVVEGGEKFKIWFNGKFISMTKTFPPIEKRINELKAEHDLQIYSEE